MPNGQLNAFAKRCGLLRWRCVEYEAMIEKGFGRVAMHSGPLETRFGYRLAGSQFGHFNVCINGRRRRRAVVTALQILTADYCRRNTKWNEYGKYIFMGMASTIESSSIIHF